MPKDEHITYLVQAYKKSRHINDQKLCLHYFLGNNKTRTMRFLATLAGLSTFILPFAFLPEIDAIIADYVQCPGLASNPIVLKGKRFFDSLSGSYFAIKGIAYYPRPNDGDLVESNSVDFFTDEYMDLWMADIEYMKQLGVNTIRIYAVDPSKNHDAFMCELKNAGIYVIIGLLADCEGCGIGPDEAPSCYPDSLKERGQFIINELSKYSNTLAFDAGNEVTLYARDGRIELNAACQKKFIRDMRSYINTCSNVTSTILPRKVPIGMANWDFERDLQTLYFNCESADPLEKPEWYGINVYQHCDPAAVTADDLTGWIQLRDDFIRYNLPVPVVVSEFGCRERFPTIGEFEAQRNWLQIGALYSAAYQEVFAGGVVFEYSAEKFIVDQSDQGKPWPYFEFMKLQYGVGYYSPVDCDHVTIPCVYNPYPEFLLLAEAFDAVDVSSIPGSQDYLPVFGSTPSCPDGLPPMSNFIWPVDDSPGLQCYVIPTNAPTSSPTPAAENPTGGGSSPSTSGNPDGGESASDSQMGHFWICLSRVAMTVGTLFLLML